MGAMGVFRGGPVHLIVSPFVAFCLILCGCQDPGGGRNSPTQVFSYESKDELKYLKAAKPFYDAVYAQDFAQAYDLMSHWASENVHPWQFALGRDPDTNQPPPRIEKLSKQEFVDRMTESISQFGPPREINDMYVEETDPDILAGQANDNWDKLDIMFAIGMMSETVPSDIRKASVRGEIHCRFNPEELQAALEEWEFETEDELFDNDIYPYFKLKTVLVEEDGELKVAYFEIVPPSMLD